MHLEDFDYLLPQDLIAQTPIEPRDAARLLVDQGAHEPLHRQMTDFVDFCQPGDVLVVNDTKVIPARLRCVRASGGSAEVLLLEQRDSSSANWEALVRPGGKLKQGETLFASDGTALVRIDSRSPAGDTFFVTLLIKDLSSGLSRDLASDLAQFLECYGEMPLPPYITTSLANADRYQTVYADRPASAAAPTAGLHFTPSLLVALQTKGIKILTVDLTVGLDTFAPITVQNPLEHPIHTESYRVSAQTLELCLAAQRVIAIGTTATRALESAATTGVLAGRTNLFISRGYEFKIVDLLLTNFHMPRTTLLLLVDAFIGSRWRGIYDIAIQEHYRMLSFGDAMLLDRTF